MSVHSTIEFYSSVSPAEALQVEASNRSSWSTSSAPDAYSLVAALWVTWACNAVVGPTLLLLGLVGNALFFKLIGTYAPGTSIAVLFRVLAISNSVAAVFAIVPFAVCPPTFI